MQSLKISILSLIVFSLSVNGKTPDNKQPCMDISHSEDVTVCMIDTAKERKETYTKEYNSYLKSIEEKGRIPYNKKATIKLAKEAKKNWDAYLKKACLVEAAIYEKDSNGFNDNYNLCLINNYTQRIEYYKKINSK